MFFPKSLGVTSVKWGTRLLLFPRLGVIMTHFSASTSDSLSYRTACSVTLSFSAICQSVAMAKYKRLATESQTPIPHTLHEL